MYSALTARLSKREDVQSIERLKVNRLIPVARHCRRDEAVVLCEVVEDG